MTDINKYLKHLSSTEVFKNLIRKIGNEDKINISDLTNIAKAIYVPAISFLCGKKSLIIFENEIEAKEFTKNVEIYFNNVYFLTKRDIKDFEVFAESRDILFERINILNKIYRNEVEVLITTIEAITQSMPISSDIYKKTRLIKKGDEIDISTFAKELVALGYKREDMVEGMSSFSIRGDIIDISYSKSKAIRIELWGDTVEEIRYFSTYNQRSIEKVEEVYIYPNTEYILTRDLSEIKENINNIAEKQKNKNIKRDIKEDILEITEDNFMGYIEKYYNCFYPEHNTLIEYIPNNFNIYLQDEKKLEDRLYNIKKENSLINKLQAEREKYKIESLDSQIEYSEFLKRIDSKKNKKIGLKNSVLTEEEDLKPFEISDKIYFKDNIELAFKDIKKALEEKYNIILIANNPNEIKGILEDRNIKLEKDKTLILKGDQEKGFIDKKTKTINISFSNILGNKKNKKKRRESQTYKTAEKIIYTDLKEGDYIVHRIYGIGKFVEIQTKETLGLRKAYVKIEYAGDTILYVPTDMMDNIKKYISSDGIQPRLSRLGTKDWQNLKTKVRNNLREVAEEFILLYAKRAEAKGFAFSKDSLWQEELENSFKYEETEDQLRCIKEIKEDMEKETPMDRLLCGDVGFGKTEVAIRAAFKAVGDQKQVIYLVPTTILALQQYNEFADRMKDFPVEIEFLSRMKTPKQQKEIIDKIKKGKIDIIIGTHRLLSEDIEFKDLGLLIIDEEHRFGVKAKERIKEMKTAVDVLTMTATPIPRTINMSLSGIRDMSVIYDPPFNRKPVKTYILEYDQDIIKEAIMYEMEREGQVFYLHNKVESIIRKKEELEEILPNLRFAVAHGKMSAKETENIMEQFIKKEIDVLITTTILESGIDIPNANTIIVEDADRLGLAQLYQIRGRVGRSHRQAYAYITFRKNKRISEVAEKRLQAIKEFTELGSGLKLAMRDLEIRGAGSLLRRNAIGTY